MQSSELGVGIESKMSRFFEEGRFAAFAISLLLAYDLLLVGLLLTPGGETGVGALADELRIWCFGYNPASGSLEWAYVFAMLVPPVLLSAFLAFFWWEGLRKLLAQPLVIVRYLAASLFCVATAGVSFALLSEPVIEGEMPFPDKALRTSIVRPHLALTNQDGQPVNLDELQGKVVILTGVYASCGHTCPQILAQAKSAIAKLSDAERADLRVVAVTLDAENDSPGVLGTLAKNQSIEAPLYNLVTGEVAEVERTLDAIGIARERDPETGVINHANQFILIDRAGKVAYRLGLGPRQERWLESALKILLAEERVKNES